MKKTKKSDFFHVFVVPLLRSGRDTQLTECVRKVTYKKVETLIKYQYSVNSHRDTKCRKTVVQSAHIEAQDEQKVIVTILVNDPPRARGRTTRRPWNYQLQQVRTRYVIYA